MAPVWIVEALNIIKNVSPGLVSRFIDFLPDPLDLQIGKEAFSNRIVMTISLSTHAGLQIVFTQELAPVTAGILNTLIRVNQNRILWLSPP